MCLSLYGWFVCVLASRVAVRLPGVCSQLQGLRDSLRGVRRGLPGCRGRAGNTPRIYLHLIPIERSGLCSFENSSLVWTQTPAIHLLLRTNVLKEAPREPKNMCGGRNCLFVFVYIYNKRTGWAICACTWRYISAAEKERLDESQQTDQITFMTLLYHPEFACASLLLSSNRVTFYSNLTDVQVMMPSTSEASQSADPRLQRR